MKVRQGLGVLVWWSGTCIIARAQSLLPAGKSGEAEAAFHSARETSALLCHAHALRPELAYRLQFHTGYAIDVPMYQFPSGAHNLDVLLRVTPENGKPVYLELPGMLRNQGIRQSEAELTGNFAVGEGAYLVEALAKDEQERACLSQWRIQAKPDSVERGLVAMLPAGTVRPLGAPSAEAAPGGRAIDRLTILFHATGSSPRSVVMNPAAVRDLADSLSAILAELPAKSVRLIVFNRDQEAVLWRSEHFQPQDVPQVVRACEQLQLGVVDYRTIHGPAQPDVLAELADAERNDPQPARAVIVMGPQGGGIREQPAAGAAALSGQPWFYLQFGMPLSNVRVSSWAGDPVAPGVTGPMGDIRSAPPSIAAPPVDPVERFVHSFKGTTLAVRNPHDLAAALRRLSKEIPAAPKDQPPSTAASKIAEVPEVKPSVGDPVEVLAKLRNHVLQFGAAVPSHTCVENVQRDWYEPREGRTNRSCDAILASRRDGGDHLRLAVTDWLRLDVAAADGREVFSWAGAPKFSDADLDGLIPDGSFGSGLWASMLLSVFRSHHSDLTLDGETELDGRAVLQYSFRIPRELSRYTVRANGSEWVTTAYTGFLLVDPVSSDLVRFVVRTEELPPSTGLCETDTTIDYNRVPLGTFDYLLPKITRQRFIDRDGGEDENTATFSGCRQFEAESTLSFGAASGAKNSTDAAPAGGLPAGSALTIELTSAFLFGQAAAGDRVEGRVVESSRGLATAGAKVVGRLTRMELDHSGNGQYVMALRWESIETARGVWPLSLKPRRALSEMRVARPGTLLRRGKPIDLPLPGEEYDALYHFPGSLPGINFKIRTEWVTR